jgi:hypothetical protein
MIIAVKVRENKDLTHTKRIAKNKKKRNLRY